MIRPELHSTAADRALRVMQIAEGAEASSRRKARAWAIARLCLMIALSPLLLPWWALQCWLDLRADDLARLRWANRPRWTHRSIPTDHGDPRPSFLTAQRVGVDPDWPFSEMKHLKR